MDIINIVPRLESESDTIYNYRIEYIEKKYNINNNLRDIIKESKIIANIKFKKCQYDIKIHNSLK